MCQAQYAVKYENADTSSKNLLLQTSFPTRNEASIYIFQLPSLLQTKGYITASVDSVFYDSSSARVILFLGEKYKWAKIDTHTADAEILDAVRWPPNSLSGNLDFKILQAWQQKILNYLEDNGHPFGKVFLDNISIVNNQVSAELKIEKGPLYKIDSIRVYGNAKISNDFLQRYLGIPNGMPYSKSKLQTISKKIAEISYVQEDKLPSVDFLATGSVLNLYLKPKRTSQVNALIGFLPNSNQADGSKKLLLTVDANVLLHNALGSGETMSLIWQQLQQRSPRLNLLYDQPYVFHSPFGVNFLFDMYKQDSLYLNINMNLGTTYKIEDRQSTSVFVQMRQTIVSGINAQQIIQTRTLPPMADVSSLNLGVGYSFNNTDYRFNPRRGNTFNIVATAGNKKIKKNNAILELKDPNDSSFDFSRLYDSVKLNAYQFRVTTSAEHFIPLGGQSTFKLGLNAGIYQSANYFRNELFQIGGYKLLRGFDEESQYVSQYAVGTLEYRYRLGLNSYFFAFTDGGWGKHILEVKKEHTYIGTGLGLSFETKAGIVNLAWAVGQRDDIPFNLRESKVHIGFASYF